MAVNLNILSPKLSFDQLLLPNPKISSPSPSLPPAPLHLTRASDLVPYWIIPCRRRSVLARAEGRPAGRVPEFQIIYVTGVPHSIPSPVLLPSQLLWTMLSSSPIPHYILCLSSCYIPDLLRVYTLTLYRGKAGLTTGSSCQALLWNSIMGRG